MLCECGFKFKCVYSIPVDGSRFRVYRCPFCDRRLKTLEVREAELPHDLGSRLRQAATKYVKIAQAIAKRHTKHSG